MFETDIADRAILRALQLDGRISNVELAERVNLSPSACLRRVRLLEDAGVIERYTMVVNAASVGFAGDAFAEITLESQKHADLDAFESAVLGVPEVMACYLVTGDYDYLLRVVVRDTADYERIHREQLTHLPGVARVKTSFSLRSIAHNPVLPIR